MVLDYINEYSPDVINFLLKVIAIAVIYIIGVKLIKVIRKIIGRSLEKANADKGLIQFIDSFAKFIMYFILILIIANGFGLTAASVTAILGSTGLTIGLALQGSLANFAGGVLILLLKPFKVGDYIRIDKNNEEGYVYEIQMFYTKLKTIDNKLIIVPNGMLADNCIINYTSLGYRAIILKFPISYNESIARVKGVLNEYIDKLDYIERGEDKTPIIYVDELAVNNIVIGMRVWVGSEDYYKYKWRITEEVKTLFDKNNIVIPFNQLDVHIN